MSDVFFFDTYALFEIVKGSETYRPYSLSQMVLTKLNLFELAYLLLRDFNEETALRFLRLYWPFAIDISDAALFIAARLRLAYKKRNMSMTDCIGYTIARIQGIRFLTGDGQFMDLPNVEFVK